MTASLSRRRARTTGSYPAFAAFAAAMASIVLFAFSPTLNPIDILSGRIFEVRVPDVVGLTQTSALVKLSESRLKGDVSFVNSSEVDRGLVASQDPDASETLRRGSTAEIKVSLGPAKVTLPDYTGQLEAKVTEELARFEIDTQVQWVNDEFFPEGTVISQDPRQGVIVLGGSTVSLVASLGPVTREIPSVTSLSVEGASFLLGKAGFALGEVVFEDNALVPRGAVVGTEPAEGTVAARDTPLTLRISAGGPPVPVPDLRTLSQEEASKRLGDLHLLVGEISDIGAVRDPKEGQVLDQVPVAGTRVRPGDLITLTVRRSAPPPPPTVPPTTAPTIFTVTTTTTSTTLVPDPAVATTVAAGG